MAHFPRLWPLTACFFIGSVMLGCSSTVGSKDESAHTGSQDGTGGGLNGGNAGTGGSSNSSGTGASASSGSATGTTGGVGTPVTTPSPGLGAGGSASPGSEDFGTRTGSAGGAGTATSSPNGPSGGVAAGEWDDNANYREFLAYLQKSTDDKLDFSKLDVTNRQFIVVEDSAGKAVGNCPLTLTVGDHQEQARTFASGRTPVFPNTLGLSGGLYVNAICAEGSARGTLPAASEDGALVLQLAAARTPVATKAIDLAFILDTTGSMAEEIDAIKDTVSAVATKLTPQQGLALRVALVAYKDYGDTYVTKVFPFTTDLASLRASISSLSAAGGGDIPEAVNEAVHVAGQLDWKLDAFARFAFLVADAPPHMHEQYDYAAESKKFLARGIQLFTVSASGQEAVGQVAFRQMAQATYATNMFVLRGGAGPQSAGGGDPTTHCGSTQTAYASGNLDDLIVQKVLGEVALYDGDPAAIPGQHVDQIRVTCPGDGGTEASADAAVAVAPDAPAPVSVDAGMAGDAAVE